MTPKAAALKIAEDFRLAVAEKSNIRIKYKEPVKMRTDTRMEATEWIKKSVRILLDYKWKLAEWKEHYAPKPTDIEWHPLFQLQTHMSRLKFLFDP